MNTGYEKGETTFLRSRIYTKNILDINLILLKNLFPHRTVSTNCIILILYFVFFLVITAAEK